ncbi:hypothetical protein ESA94_10165 [Lacibacter luteus]|uniref:Uncharacterized protein n=1 Tax=Lacibacter luteus TaxID=2508719 RepID=A0A4Q1CJM3_9BACT|nr:hypothetical protein [Lacibacter luteus]RXK60816.1 hypothetical protein ESA94_10165 [Lacibacter luteus]
MEENKPIHNEEENGSPSIDDSRQQNTQLNTPSTDEPIAPATETSEIINPTSEIKDMEVHHHTHSGHGKKNWKSYFWEFLMLFLAVFCGFLAEYQLEHVIENSRETQFIRSYIEDLKLDTASINRNLVYQKERKLQLDSMMNFLETQTIKGHESDFYYLGRVLLRTRRFQSSDRTITQLKNSGALRLIRNEQAADSIISYQKLVETILGNIADERDERRDADPLVLRIFNPYVFDKMLDDDNIIHKPAGNPPLRSYDASLHQDLAYRFHQLKGSNRILFTRLTLLHQKASAIITFLQNEYHLN